MIFLPKLFGNKMGFLSYQNEAWKHEKTKLEIEKQQLKFKGENENKEKQKKTWGFCANHLQIKKSFFLH